MFPSFTSLAQREQKRIDLLERTKLRVKQKDESRRMYAEAAWATDANKTISLDKNSTQNSSVQVGDGDLKKLLISKETQTSEAPMEKSQEIPEVNEEIPEVKYSERSAESEKKDSNPSISDEFIAKKWITNIYKSNPNWVSLKFNPVKTNNSVDMKRYIGKNGGIYSVKSNKKSPSKYIDWVRTAEALMDIRSDAESNSIDEVSLMRMEDSNTPYHNYNITGSKRHNEMSSGQATNKIHVRPTWFHDSSSATDIDEERAKSKLLFMLKAYKGKLTGSNISIRPVLKDGEILDKYELIIDSKGDLNVRNQETQRNKQSRLSEISWPSTLALFSETVKSRGLTFDFEPSPDTVLDTDPNRFKSTQGIWYKGKLAGPDVENDLSVPDVEAKSIITDYFVEEAKNHVIFPIHLIPIVSGKTNNKYYFSVIDNNLKVRNQNIKKLGGPSSRRHSGLQPGASAQHPVLSGKAHTSFFKRIQWSATLDLLIDYMDEMETYLISELGGPSSRRHSGLQPGASAHQKPDKETAGPLINALNLFAYVLKAHGVKIKDPILGSSLKGRGLRGAGLQPLEGVKRKTNQTYNLNDIQGMATPSAYIYRKLGSKFIRLSDLDKRTLTIVQQNRKKVGPMREISDALQGMIKDLVFKNNIEQQKYNKLSVYDKKLFKEILEMTHLQYNFVEKLEDPLESLRMEYDKLKGELMLGNDNHSILKQLKVVCVDMYSNRLISDMEFKDIITILL